MKDPKPILCEITALTAGETKQRIQVFPGPGDYVHPKSGPFTLTREHLDEFADAINASEIPSDRDHAFYKGMSAPAAGWLQQGTAVASDEGVFSEVEWTPTAAQQVADKEYRFISPEFAFAKREPDGRSVSEPTLHAITLTNRPFFKMMSPIAAEVSLEDDLLVAEAFGEEIADTLAEMSEEAAQGVIAAAMTKVGAKPGQAANTAASKYADPGYQKDGRKRYALDNEKEVRAAWTYVCQAKNAAKYESADLARVKARIKRAMNKLGITIGADATTGGDMDLTALAESLGIAADASEEDVLAAATAVAAENADLKKKLESAPTDETMKTLIADAAKGVEASNKLAVLERNTTIDSAIERGAIVPAERESFEGLWALDPEGVAKILAEKPAGVKLADTGRAVITDKDGKPLSEDGEITADTTPVSVDGELLPVDRDSAELHAATTEILRKAGKTAPSAEEYAIAAEKALTTLGKTRGSTILG